MSVVSVDTLAAGPRSGGRIVLDRRFTLSGDARTPGSVIQTVTVRSDARSTFSSPTSGIGTRITPLTLTVTPRRSDSTLLCRWMINGELHHDNNLVIHRGSQMAPGGVNAPAGAVRSAGYVSGFYDVNEDSTPSNWFVMYFDAPGSAAEVSYCPAVRASGGSAYTFALNRTLNGSTGDAYESGVSVGVLMEIAGEGV